MWRRRLIVATGHPFPLPPCLVGYCGRSRWTDRLRPIVFIDLFGLWVHAGVHFRGVTPKVAKQY